jgi:hypothetical protein
MMFSGRRSWCSISLPVKGLQALGDLRHDVAHAVQGGCGWSRIHCASVCRPHAPAPRTGAARALGGVCLQHMSAVYAACDPLFQHEAVERGVVAAQFDRRDLQHHLAAAGVVARYRWLRCAGVQFTHDACSRRSCCAVPATAAAAGPGAAAGLGGVGGGSASTRTAAASGCRRCPAAAPGLHHGGGGGVQVVPCTASAACTSALRPGARARRRWPAGRPHPPRRPAAVVDLQLRAGMPRARLR